MRYGKDLTRRQALIAGGALSLTACVTKNADSDISAVLNQDWETLSTEPFKGKRDAVSFVSEAIGWYGTGRGDLFQTRNGGQSWVKVKSSPGTFIRALAFENEQDGYIGNIGTGYYPNVEDETPLYQTRDGGQTWQAVDTGQQTIKGVCAIHLLRDERIYQGEANSVSIIHAAGRVGGPTGILRSIDSGSSWQVIDMSDQAAMILDVIFFSKDEGLVCASTSKDLSEAEGSVLRTLDGGKTWSQAYRSGRPGELVWKCSFPKGPIGFATVQSYDTTRSQQTILKTSDWGRNWEELILTENAKARQFGIGFLDELRGWVGTFEGGFYTADGGKSFTAVPIAKGANKFQILRNTSGQAIAVYAIGSEVQKLPLSHSNAKYREDRN